MGSHRGVSPLQSIAFDTIPTLLSQPVLASVLGLILGAALFLTSRLSFKVMRPDDPSRGLLLMAAALLGRLVFATVALLLYHRFAPEGIKAFGLALAGAFVVAYTVELVRFAGLHRYVRPQAGIRDGR